MNKVLAALILLGWSGIASAAFMTGNQLYDVRPRLQVQAGQYHIL
jgi:hypothetical protein